MAPHSSSKLFSCSSEKSRPTYCQHEQPMNSYSRHTQLKRPLRFLTIAAVSLKVQAGLRLELCLTPCQTQHLSPCEIVKNILKLLKIIHFSQPCEESRFATCLDTPNYGYGIETSECFLVLHVHLQSHLTEIHWTNRSTSISIPFDFTNSKYLQVTAAAPRLLLAFPLVSSGNQNQVLRATTVLRALR